MTICITGATGFLGSRLLAGLLETGTGPVTALVRDRPGPGLERIAAAVAAAGGDPEAVRARVATVQIDLTAPRLGLDAHRFRSLAGAITDLWHCAASVDLGARLARLAPVNVEGVRRVLELAAAARGDVRLMHVSTAFVAGARDGVAAEDDLDGSAGFNSAYEESKFRAEALVREWARRTGRHAVVLRPSVLTTDEPVAPGAPGHTLAALAAAVARATALRVPGVPAQGGGRVLRFPAPADATLNLLQVDHAVDAMLALARTDRTGTFHITHPVDTPVRDLLDAVEELLPGFRLELDEDRPAPTIAERFVGRAFGAFLAYRGGRRRYDRSRLLDALPGLAAPAPIDRDYLRGALRAPGRPTATANRSLRARHV